MTLKKIKFICELLTEQMNHWMLFPLALTVMGMDWEQTGPHKPEVLLWFLCSLFPLAFFGLRVYCDREKRLLHFVLLHAAAAATIILILFSLPFYTPSFINRTICILCALFYIFYSVFLCIKRETVYTFAIPIIAAVALSLGASIFRQSDAGWNTYYSISLILSLTLFALVYYMHHYIEFLSVNKNSVGYLPASEMFHSGMGLVTVYALFGMLLLFFGTQFAWVSNLLNDLEALAMKFLRWLKSFLPEREPKEWEYISRGEVEINQVQNSFQQREGFWGWKVLAVLFFAVIIAILLFVAFKLLKHLVRLLDAYIKRKFSTEQEQEEEDVVDIREKCDTGKNMRKELRDFSIVLTYREQVRRLYKRKVLSATAERKQERRRIGFRTAREWENELQTLGMADVYEQARYSEREITGEDVKRMKEACKL